METGDEAPGSGPAPSASSGLRAALPHGTEFQLFLALSTPITSLFVRKGSRQPSAANAAATKGVMEDPPAATEVNVKGGEKGVRKRQRKVAAEATNTASNPLAAGGGSALAAADAPDAGYGGPDVASLLFGLGGLLLAARVSNPKDLLHLCTFGQT